jgi:hypothetical protein
MGLFEGPFLIEMYGMNPKHSRQRRKQATLHFARDQAATGFPVRRRVKPVQIKKEVKPPLLSLKYLPEKLHRLFKGFAVTGCWHRTATLRTYRVFNAYFQ